MVHLQGGRPLRFPRECVWCAHTRVRERARTHTQECIGTHRSPFVTPQQVHGVGAGAHSFFPACACTNRSPLATPQQIHGVGAGAYSFFPLYYMVAESKPMTGKAMEKSTT